MNMVIDNRPLSEKIKDFNRNGYKYIVKACVSLEENFFPHCRRTVFMGYFTCWKIENNQAFYSFGGPWVTCDGNLHPQDQSRGPASGESVRCFATKEAFAEYLTDLIGQRRGWQNNTEDVIKNLIESDDPVEFAFIPFTDNAKTPEPLGNVSF